MKKIILLVISSFILLYSNAQNTQNNRNTLNGKITKITDNTPLAGATVYIPDVKIGAVSKGDGSYQINNVPNGSYLIEVTFLGYAPEKRYININGPLTVDFSMTVASIDAPDVVITGVSNASDLQHTPQSITEVTQQYIKEHASTNVIDAISQIPGISGLTNGQSISKPVIRGLGYNRVVTVNDGVIQQDQAWFDEFGIEADPDAVDRFEIIKGPASLAYGSDAIAGVVNLIPEQPLPEGQSKGEILYNYQTNNGLMNQMARVAGTQNGIAWSARADYMAAHAYQNKFDGYVLNSQFNNFNTDATLGVHRKWGYSQFHFGYFDMATGIVDGTRDSATGIMERQVSYPGLNGGAATFVIPTKQEQKSYTPFCINQRIRHTKLVWDNSIAVGKGRITGIFSFQQNQRQETNDPTIPNTPDIYYFSKAGTFDVRYILPQMKGLSISIGTNGAYQMSQSLGTVLLIPDYNLFQAGAFAIATKKVGKLNLSGGIRYDVRKFSGLDHWVDSTTQAPAQPNAANAFHEFNGFTTNFSGLSGSIGAAYDITKDFYVKANVAKGFRAPSVVECAANGVHDGTPVFELGDNTLKPESNVEADVAVGINSKDVTIELDGFVNSISDFIYAKSLQSKLGGDSISNALRAAGLGAAPVYKYSQTQATLYGGEVGLNIHPTALPWVELHGTFSMVEGGLVNVADSLKHLPFVPPMRITADLEFHTRKLNNVVKNAYFKVGILNCFQQKNIYQQSAVYSGLDPNATPYEYKASKTATAGYVLLNAGFGGDIVSKGHTVCELYVLCNNLLNTTYMDYMSRFKYLPVNNTTQRVGVFNMGRNLSIKLIVPIDFKKP